MHYKKVRFEICNRSGESDLSITFEFDPDNRLCVYRVDGPVTPGRLLEAFGKAVASPGWSDDYNFLTLLNKISLADLSHEAIDHLMSVMEENDTAKPSGSKRLAAIVSEDPACDGILIYWEHQAAKKLKTQERVFRSERLAREWLASV